MRVTLLIIKTSLKLQLKLGLHQLSESQRGTQYGTKVNNRWLTLSLNEKQ